MLEPSVNPFPLGKIAPTSGTPLSLMSNFADYDPACNKFEVTADKDNAGYVYIGTATMNRTTLEGVMKRLDPGESWDNCHNVGGNVYNLSVIYVDVDTTTDYAYATMHVN